LRDAIVVSGWTWEATNVPERLAISLAQAGARVLYCENPISLARRRREPELTEVIRNVHRFQPRCISHRLSSMPVLSQAQGLLLARQIAKKAKVLKLVSPVLFYPHGVEALLLAEQMKRWMGFNLVHFLMDYELPDSLKHAEISDVSLVIPRAAFTELHARFDGKVHPMRQISMPAELRSAKPSGKAAEFAAELPRPRLLYLGDLIGRTDEPLVLELLRRHPEWHFISFGATQLDVPNHHVLPWLVPGELSALLNRDAIGFLPYRLTDPKNLHCVPLKLFDFFEARVPVVATPIAYLKECADLVYAGANCGELETAIQRAQTEAADSPLKERRLAFSRAHTTENCARWLSPLLTNANEFPPPDWDKNEVVNLLETS